ncbi:MAG: NUDIX domain-containing protein [Armatimonadetes bacterium]|nr:NUDIX domain-containing protein [Armatimonadota bacterium]
MKGTVTVSAAVIEQGKVLLVQEGKEWCKGQWSLPGGRLEENESLADAVVREMQEETGLLIRPTGMTRVLRYTSQRGFHVIRFNFVAQLLGGVLRGGEMPDATGEIIGCAWHNLAELAANPGLLDLRTPEIAQTIFRDLHAGAIFPLETVFDGFAIQK